MHEYETIVIIRPDLDDAETYGIVEKCESVIADHNGHLLIREDWGKKRMAYMIQKHVRGHYILLNFLGKNELVAELERAIGFEDRVIRYMSIKRGEGVDVEARIEQASEQRRLRDEQEQAKVDAAEKAAADADAAAEKAAALAASAAETVTEAPAEVAPSN